MSIKYLSFSRELKVILNFKTNLNTLHKIEENFWSDYAKKNKGFGIGFNATQIQSFIQRTCDEQENG